VPPNFGKPVSFNRALPIYGGKTMKTNCWYWLWLSNKY
jgi:hypothetical protein